MPNKKTPKPKPLYRRKPPPGTGLTPKTQRREEGQAEADFTHARTVAAAHFELREDGTIQGTGSNPQIAQTDTDLSEPGRAQSQESEPSIPNLIFRNDNPFVRLYHANCLELLDAIAAKHPQGRFDAIFADPPYFLSNGGITCHAGRMVKVHKGDWDKSRGPELNHEFNLEWLRRCQRVLKPNGTIWMSGTHHVIFSIGYAMQQLGFKILNDIAWEKPNPPPNLSCRYFTHSTETILWAARDEKSKHVFNYQEMRKVTGKQMKTVWKSKEFEQPGNEDTKNETTRDASGGTPDAAGKMPALPGNIWTMSAPANDEKTLGKHPTQKPVALIERCLRASTNPGDMVLDPFLGGGTTAIAAIRLKRGCVGVEADAAYILIAAKRADREIILIWLRHFRVCIEVSIFYQPSAINNQPTFDLDLFSDSINGSGVDDKPQVPTERIFHECKFVFLSCAEVERGAVVHTTVDVSLQEAWAKTPNGKKRETTHVVRCETEIFRIKGL